MKSATQSETRDQHIKLPDGPYQTPQITVQENEKQKKYLAGKALLLFAIVLLLQLYRTGSRKVSTNPVCK
jgi:hypothetical protein